ncbi:hypothetical protein IB223_03435 [Pseudoxanthomonas sp. PXM03]|jgi:hypothetical protein|uniref:hypothetical protein n=1 Tax=unclassified Pseudoxanthomonas TaxID=2645906 RepID=UPI00177D881E|nr:hypothetical protein [Pseudoxanthomonas sp. PXM03]MBD9435136.1 hypothetical protein [Pseudoxanthomonas sp. PXM03]
MHKAIVLGVLLVTSSVAHAKIDSLSTREGSRNALDIQSPFEAQQQRILNDLAGGEKYGEISPQDSAKVKEALSRMSSQLDRANGSVDGLSAEQRVAVLNDQELINAILTHAGEESRLVCTREKPVGTRRATTHCITVAERRRHREEARNEMDKNFRSPIID